LAKSFKKSSVLRIYSFLGKKPFLYFIGLIGSSLVSLAFNSMAAVALKGMTDAIVTKSMPTLVHTLTVVGICLAAVMVGIPLFTYFFESSVRKTTARIRKALFEHIEKLPMKLIEEKHSGDLISRLTNDIQTAENAYSQQILMVLMSFISGVGSGIIIFTIDWRLAIIALLLGAMNTLANTVFIKPLKKVSDKIQNQLSGLNQKLTDMLGGIQVIRMFNISKHMEDKFNENSNEVRKWSINRVIKNSLLNGLNSFLGLMGFTGMVVIGSIMVINGMITFGNLIAVTQMMNGILFMFNALGGFITQLQGSLAGAERVFEILDMPIEEEENKSSKHNALDLDHYKAVQLEKVHFAYEEDQKVLNGVDIELSRNQVIALVGSSGGGKSTIFKLLLRFQNFKEGSIKIFSKPIMDMSIKELRKAIAYVPQDNYLFSGTIADNIGYGKENATMDEIIEAAKAANAHEFIQELPEQYKTEVGERGAHLSGGQRQRIAIARAILKNAPILLLDEATSALDSESERAVQSALESLMKGRSTMVVAHRLSTIRNADKIYVLENGIITERGNHEELLKADKTYTKLYNMQFQE
jgi:ATP-binding cassette, subfamily B, bacterial